MIDRDTRLQGGVASKRDNIDDAKQLLSRGLAAAGKSRPSETSFAAVLSVVFPGSRIVQLQASNGGKAQ